MTLYLGPILHDTKHINHLGFNVRARGSALPRTGPTVGFCFPFAYIYPLFFTPMEISP